MSEPLPYGATCTTCDKVKERYKWTTDEKKAFKELARWCLDEWPSLHRAFVNLSRTLAAKGDEMGYDWDNLVKFEQELAAVCLTGNMVEASVKMADYLVFGVEKYLGGSDDASYQQVLKELSGFRERLAP